MPERVERTDPDGVDYTWVMQVTFLLTLGLGVPVVVALAMGRSLPTWRAKATFVLRVGALVWLVTALGVYAVERRRS